MPLKMKPCEDGRHTFTIPTTDKEFMQGMRCENEGCPIFITGVELVSIRHRSELIELVKRKERDWWLEKEIEG